MLENFLSQMQEYISNAPLFAFASAYFAGILVSFTPCIYPVIPITLGYIGGRSEGSRRRAFSLSLVYVLGLALVYSGLGLFAAMSGKLFGSINSHPASLFIMANICLVLGLSMLGVFHIPSLGFKSRGAPKKPKGLIGALFVGAGSGLVVGPCTAPVLGVILIYVAKTGNLAYGTALLFVFALGLGTLLVLLGTFAGLLANLPKSGPWMNKVKVIFGWILIFIAEYFLIQMGERLI